MQTVISELKRRGDQKVYLWVLEKNISTRRFYERFGFMLSGRILTATFAGKELKKVQYILVANSIILPIGIINLKIGGDTLDQKQKMIF